jgi:tetratricopeptide (TPR) repeat protein
MANSSGSSLQHPRRSLGNRHRSQAKKFLALAQKTPQISLQNLKWAEQSARQAVLHDFTHEENWRMLAEIKTLAEDENGLRAVLEDLFAVLGRDPEHLQQLAEVNMLEHGFSLLSASLTADPLDPEYWEQLITPEFLGELENRFFHLDLSDPRANVLFGRRLERVRTIDEELFIRLVRKLLAQRPFNHEAWIELGHLHEKRHEYDEAWFCYDQAQTHFPQITPRDKFRSRMEKRLDSDKEKWAKPDSSSRVEFLKRMELLALKVATPIVSKPKLASDEEEKLGDEEENIRSLLQNQEYSSAFFLARRLVTSGEEWAIPYLEQAQGHLTDST